jgi:hypothetical protein
MRPWVRRAWGAVLFLAVGFAAGWALFDLLDLEAPAADWMRAGIAAILLLGLVKLVRIAVRCIRGKLAPGPAAREAQEAFLTAACLLIVLWAFWLVFQGIQHPRWRGFIEPVVGVFSKRIGFWVLWLVVVPFAVILIVTLLRFFWRGLLRLLRQLGE